MNERQRTELMHAVLDGEASAEESRRLHELLAVDAAAAAEFAQWRQLHQGLAAVEPRHAPEGLVASVLAAAHQPFPEPRVFASSSASADVQGFNPNRHTLKPVSTQRTMIMSSGSNRKYWIGGTVAAVAVVVVAQFGLGGYPKDSDVSGTIVPAERHRAAQPTAGDIKLGTAGGSGQSGGALPAAADQSAQNSAEKSAQGAAEKSAQGAAEKSAQGAAEKSAQGAAAKAAQAGAEKSAQSAAEKSAQSTAEKSAQAAAEKSAQAAAEKSAAKAAQGSAQK